ncbi:uncharacterized protein LOC111067865 [Drosophila obscura]|uniref:uncharacterized protein LOC111067865 n=1 Tax=Drosophila obscura TaxID=7282 RepID=UPI001BB2CDFF|nr:uncharacterized protein LOC111067865 [Drosophila obscura]
MESVCYPETISNYETGCDPAPGCDREAHCEQGPCRDPGSYCDQGPFCDPESICYCGKEVFYEQCQVQFSTQTPRYDQESICEQEPDEDLHQEPLYEQEQEPLYAQEPNDELEQRNDQEPICEEEEEEQEDEEAFDELPSYIHELIYAQEPEAVVEQPPIHDDPSPGSSNGQRSSPNAMPDDTFAFMWGQNANDWELQLFPELYGRMPTLPSYADIFGQPSYCTEFEGLAAPCQTGGIRSTPDGLFSDIPGSMIPDQYGMVGLLSAMRASHSNPAATQLVFGEDLTMCGLDLTAPGDIYVHFNGPFTNEPPPRNVQDIAFEMSMRQMRDAIAMYPFYPPVWDPFVPETGHLGIVFDNEEGEKQEEEQQQQQQEDIFEDEQEEEQQQKQQAEISDEEQLQQEETSGEELEQGYDQEPPYTLMLEYEQETSTDSDSDSETSSELSLI